MAQNRRESCPSQLPINFKIPDLSMSRHTLFWIIVASRALNKIDFAMKPISFDAGRMDRIEFVARWFPRRMGGRRASYCPSVFRIFTGTLSVQRKPNKTYWLANFLACLVAASLTCCTAAASELGSPEATTTIDGKQLPPPPPPFGGVIKEKASESTPWWPPRVVPPKGAPNVLLIMTDDQGFGAPSTFGGVIPTPTMDRLAREGLRYTNFHSTSLCSPSRAAIITGRNHHSVGYGVVGEVATGYPGYDSIIPIDKGTIGTILKENGYATAWFGKDHNTPSYQSSQAGPFNQWPNGMGFDYFYGFVGGDASQWQPNLFRNTTAIYPFRNNPSWNLETAMADEAIHYIKQLKEIAPGKPWFVYYVPGATHAPHHPTPEWAKKISEMHLFDEGWNKVRETIFANQKRLGVMPENARLTPWPKELPSWDSLSWDEKKLFIKQADIYGAYLAYADNEIGRVIQEVQDLGELDNTLIIYIGGDNGASAEGMLNGTPNEFTTFNGVAVPVKDQFLWYPFWGSDRTFPHYAAEWAWAMDTPFKWVKQVASHYGGTAQGMVISWPGHINDPDGVRRQFHHLIDIVPTILDATGIPAPDTIDGIKQKPIEGVSMAYTFDKANANAPSRHTTQYFEMLGNRAIYHDGWIAATTPATLPWELSTAKPPDVITGYNWELYNVKDDPTEYADLAAKMPEKLKEMQELFYSEAKKYDVLPLDNSTLARWNTPRPSLTAGRKEFTYSGVLTGVPAAAAPSILNKAFKITAEVEIPEGGAEGMIVTQGGRFGGYGLFLSHGIGDIRRGKVVFLYNLLDLQRTIWDGPELGAGKHTIVFDYKPDGPGLGKGGTGVLSVDGQEVSRKSMEHSTPITFPEDESFDVGEDTRTGVAMLEYRYDVPFKFTGKIDNLAFDLGPDLSAEK
ncbi:arylsulfatase [Rhodoblastus acidophilus]|uniref:Arylsulfatase n=1 Tax=Candidatus Rhodoblastus alkanivorans TaxID=2954117 RepID=A0ABS9Z8J8_9HYPH|nr:arylsulfatase [Candidatus Rhodoblastus alkanivorans]MCI4680348.1 arylsulfatase [Candidatus Rhodoblastus alkanivorans]MCI4683999.1 arylsulfatase [Candidatus Rhodoblastus alkanivorans]MDI4641318.1 arylsulfatase [Rhodoblastus acidophilus]